MFKHFKNIAVFMGIILFIFLSIEIYTYVPVVEITPSAGMADITSIDLSSETALIFSREDWAFYKNQLYTPQDFITGNIKTSNPFKKQDEFQTQFGTYRMILKLPEMVTYGICMSSLDYSQRVFINGTEQEAVGTVGDIKEKTIPKSKYTIFYFTPQTDRTELILQYANFNHRSGGFKYPIYVSRYNNITHKNQASILKSCIIIGCMLTIFIFYLGMHLFFGRKKYFLYFALCCLSVGIRELLVGEKPVSILFSNINWYVSIRIEYLSLICAYMLFFAFVNSLFPGLLHKYLIRFALLISGIYTIIVIVAQPVIYSRLLLYFQIMMIAGGVYVFVKLGQSLKNIKMENTMIFIGGIAFFFGAVSDTLYHSRLTHYRIGGLTQSTMMIFVFANMIAMAVQYSRTEKELYIIKKKEQALSEENLLLDRLNQIKTEFLANISHEMKTPLTVMSGYAQLSYRKIKEDLSHKDILTNMEVISSEADRLAIMVGQLLNLTRLQEDKRKVQSTDISDILNKVKLIFLPLIEEKRNQLIVKNDKSRMLVMADNHMIYQVLLNLLSNANRHTADGIITLTAAQDGEFVSISVSDTGCGIDKEKIPWVFDRFYKYNADEAESQNKQTGLGLAICKKIIEEHGGAITIQSEVNQGTTVKFTLMKKENMQMNRKKEYN